MAYIPEPPILRSDYSPFPPSTPFAPNFGGIGESPQKSFPFELYPGSKTIQIAKELEEAARRRAAALPSAIWDANQKAKVERRLNAAMKERLAQEEKSSKSAILFEELKGLF